MNARTEPALPHALILRHRDLLRAFALETSRSSRRFLSMREARAIADLATVEAAVRWSPARRVPFLIYARPWVRGAILRAIRLERTHASIDASLAEAVVAARPPSAERVAGARLLLGRLTDSDFQFLVEHHIEELTYIELGAAGARCSAWACRHHARLAAALSRGTTPRRLGQPRKDLARGPRER
jgi:hypothetical protein